MHTMLYNIPGEWSYSTNLMWKEQEVPATVIGVDKSAGVGKADRTLNDSWCRVGYLWTLHLRPKERVRTRMHPSTKRAEERNRLVSLSLLCCSKVKPPTKDQGLSVNIINAVFIMRLPFLMMCFNVLCLLSSSVSTPLSPCCPFHSVSKWKSPRCNCGGRGGWRWTS